ncbi:hypothetical protein [Acetobacter sp. DsW_063]|uniref:hypothetical protein n=1 Tax=Acetobacter sp. DsW_063 TaxID=1514894 RepID=UPI000A3CC5F5|nr:hypothetical protein [Acetobacter sp. DsW_063]OUJ12672.1 hypothetical protein HK28_03125 [Acetobacter sp. DsW_063]
MLFFFIIIPLTISILLAMVLFAALRVLWKPILVVILVLWAIGYYKHEVAPHYHNAATEL